MAAYSNAPMGTMAPASAGMSWARSPLEAPRASAKTTNRPICEMWATTVKATTAIAGRQEVADRTRHRGQDVVAHVVLEVARVHRRRFGPADDREVRDHRDRRQQNGADGIDMLDGIQRDTSQHAGRRIA